MKTAFFGGSFDPPHTGHLRLAELVLKHGFADRVLFVPAWEQPFKIGKASVSWADRFTMLELMTKHEKAFSVSDVEKRLGGISYTFETLEFLSMENPGETFLLMMGADSLLSLHEWHRGRELAEKYPLIVFPRPGYPVTKDSLIEHWDLQRAEKLFASYHGELGEMDASSTNLRKKLEKNDLTEGILNDKVRAYIQTRSLYRMNEEKKQRPSSSDLADFCAQIADDRKARNIVKIDLTQYPAAASMFVICTGTSAPHLRAVTEKIRRTVLEKYGIRATGKDGSPESSWMIVDFGDVMVHVMTEETRNTYQLETLWSDAPRTEAVHVLNEKAKSSRLI